MADARKVVRPCAVISSCAMAMSTPDSPRLTPARLESFSDGVLSIAATLLVLDLRVPDASSNLAAALAAQWSSYATYIVSFLTIGIIWVNHHSLFAHVRHVDRRLLFLNLLLLLVVSAIPFPTSVLGRYIGGGDQSHIAAAVYGAVMVVMSIAFSALWRHVTSDGRLLGAYLDPERARHDSLLFSAGLLGYVLGVGLSFLSAELALAVYALVALFYVFPWLPEAKSSHQPA
jgi:uncharacterized membrane protein